MSSKMIKRHFCRSENFFKTYLTPFFNVVFNADSESVFKSFLSHLEPKKSELKTLKIISISNTIAYPVFLCRQNTYQFYSVCMFRRARTLKHRFNFIFLIPKVLELNSHCSGIFYRFSAKHAYIASRKRRN